MHQVILCIKTEHRLSPPPPIAKIERFPVLAAVSINMYAITYHGSG